MTGRLIILHTPDRLAQLYRPNPFVRQDQASSANGIEGHLSRVHSGQCLWQNQETHRLLPQTTVSANIRDTPYRALSP